MKTVIDHGYSEEMAWLMDQEIQKMIIHAESRTTEILTGKRHALDALAEAMMKEEMLERADVERNNNRVRKNRKIIAYQHLVTM